MDRLKSTGACLLKYGCSIAFCLVVLLGCRVADTASTGLPDAETNASVSNLVQEIGLPLLSELSLLQVRQGARLNEGYREWVFFSSSATNVRATAKARVSDGGWVDSFPVDSAVAMIEMSIKEKCVLPRGAAVGAFEDRGMTYQMIIVDVKDGAYLMIRRMPGGP